MNQQQKNSISIWDYIFYAYIMGLVTLNFMFGFHYIDEDYLFAGIFHILFGLFIAFMFYGIFRLDEIRRLKRGSGTDGNKLK